MSFPGSEIKEVKDGEVLSYPNVLSCGPLEPQGGWTLAGEDPKYYRKSKLWKTARREWPDVPYPVPSKPTPAPAEEEGDQDTASHSQEDLKELMAIHHSFTKLLEKLGVDPCADYQEQKVENILVGIKSSDLQCKVCGKIYTTSMRMKRHFKKRHIGKTNYQCKICKKYYTDASSLKEHEGNHDESLRPHKCTKYSKRFATEYKLTEHLLMHQGKTFIVLSPNVADSSPTRRGNRTMSPNVHGIQRSQRISLSHIKSAPEDIGTTDLCLGMRKKSIKPCGLCGLCGSFQFLCGSEFRVFFTFPVTLS